MNSNTGIVYVCSHCQSWEVQPIGRVVQDDKGNKKFKSAPKSSKGAVCEFCDSVQHVSLELLCLLTTRSEDPCG